MEDFLKRIEFVRNMKMYGDIELACDIVRSMKHARPNTKVSDSTAKRMLKKERFEDMTALEKALWVELEKIVLKREGGNLKNAELFKKLTGNG